MVFLLLDNEGGFDNFIGLAVFQPIIAVIISVLITLGCLVVGLPIRLNKKLKKWWTQYYYFAIVLTFIGITLLVLSLMPYYMETFVVSINGFEIIKVIPNDELLVTGWLLTGFSTLHIYPPNKFINLVQDILTKIQGKYKRIKKISF